MTVILTTLLRLIPEIVYDKSISLIIAAKSNITQKNVIAICIRKVAFKRD